MGNINLTYEFCKAYRDEVTKHFAALFADLKNHEVMKRFPMLTGLAYAVRVQADLMNNPDWPVEEFVGGAIGITPEDYGNPGYHRPHGDLFIEGITALLPDESTLLIMEDAWREGKDPEQAIAEAKAKNEAMKKTDAKLKQAVEVGRKRG